MTMIVVWSAWLSRNHVVWYWLCMLYTLYVTEHFVCSILFCCRLMYKHWAGLILVESRMHVPTACPTNWLCVIACAGWWCGGEIVDMFVLCTCFSCDISCTDVWSSCICRHNVTSMTWKCWLPVKYTLLSILDWIYISMYWYLTNNMNIKQHI